MQIDWIRKVDPQKEESLQGALAFAKEAKHIPQAQRPGFYGDGHAADKMIQALQERQFL